VVVAQVLVALTLKPGGSQLVYSVFCYLVLTSLATAAAMACAIRGTRATRIFWSFIAFSYGLLWLIDWSWVYHVVVLHGKNPFSAFHDTVFFLQPVPLMVAATTYPHWKQSFQMLYRTTLNLVLLLFFWVFVYAYFVFSYWFVDASTFHRQFNLFYSAENLFLVAILAHLVARSHAPWRRLYWHLFGASCLWTLSLQLQNVGFSNGYSLGGWLDVPAVASCCWFVWVPLLGLRLAPQLMATAEPLPSSRRYVSFSAMLAVLAIPLIGGWEIFHPGTDVGMHRFRLLTVLLSFVCMALASFAKEQIANREVVDDIASNLRFSEERFSKAFDSSPEGITISTLSEGRYIEVNDAFLKMTGYSRAEILGKAAAELGIWCNPDERTRIVEEIVRNERVRSAQARFRTKSAETREVEISAEGIQLQGEACLIAITRDVTQHKLLEQQLRQAQKMEAVGRLAGGVAHDFNNLLGVILACSELLEKDVDAFPPLAKRVETIKSACERAASLTSQLLAFSRRQMLQPAVINLNSTVADTGQMLQRLMGEDIEQKMMLDPALGQVKADPGQMVQVIMNLAVNARDAMPQGGKLIIATSNVVVDGDQDRIAPIPPGRYVMLAVSDSGTGMDEQVQSHIFEPFYTTKPAGKGTGLGLATVLGIVEQSGGHIVVESEPGEGTTFRIYLPRVDEHVPSSEASNVAAGVRGSECVLLVEDDSDLRHLIHEGLRNEGYKVLVAANGVEALGLVRRYQDSIDAIVTDVIMPLMNGPDLVRSLVLLRPDIKVLYMSGYTDDKLEEMKISGTDVVLVQKPFQLSTLGLRLREVLNSHSTSVVDTPRHANPVNDGAKPL
jgi:two-component system, cell cycle sensor histidine kinase and response regulator CckA